MALSVLVLQEWRRYVWCFPYVYFRNGGGAFLIPYFLSLFLMGIPMFFLELNFGQFASLGPLKIWRMNPAMKGVGMSVVLITACIIVYYNVVVSWCVYFFFASMTSQLPWSDCENEWNTCRCRDTTMNTSLSFPWHNDSRLAQDCINFTNTANKTTTPAEEYFLRRVLRRTEGIDHGGAVLWDVSLCNLLAWTIVFLVIARGVETLGKVMYFASIFPYVLLTALLIRGLTLEGHSTGIDFYLTPNITKLTDASVWSDAAVQIFYSLGICQGGLIAMSSFSSFKTNTLRDALIVPIINCGTSFYAGFVIFSVLGFMADRKDTSVANVVADGPGLVFMVYPEALAQMPVAPLWSILFFLMMTMLGLTSQFSATETVLCSIMDEFPSLRASRLRTAGFRASGCLVLFLLGLPMTTEGGFYLFYLIDNYVGGLPLLFAGVFQIIAVIYVYGVGKFKKDIEMMLGKRLVTKVALAFFIPMWCFVTPACLMGVIIFKCVQLKPLAMESYVYPDFGNAIGWISVSACILIVPGWFIGYYCYMGGGRLLAEVNSPKMKWGPANPDDRGERYKLPDYGVYSRDIMENESKVTPHQVEPILGVDSRVEGEAGAGADNLAYKET
ncbi:sodium- and chloride-dependent glycine transporter 2-like isoform X2 [Dreissena polymorpha]|uniref:sodium- and chloride-dependent glycine transporter 2-like isoform X2 n=1 Tax=Dreissena polymorpha TaxID=45954 RepID=UPI0022650DEC|nr:sodium- and chloride-dependent glycine transporter 2-like isoform X2 [Dreissena polymorpha]